MGLINKVDMVCLSPVGYGVWLGLASGSWLVAVIHFTSGYTREDYPWGSFLFVYAV